MLVAIYHDCFSAKIELEKNPESNVDTSCNDAHEVIEHTDDRNPQSTFGFYFNNLIRKATWKEYQPYFYYLGTDLTWSWFPLHCIKGVVREKLSQC